MFNDKQKGGLERGKGPHGSIWHTFVQSQQVKIEIVVMWLKNGSHYLITPYCSTPCSVK